MVPTRGLQIDMVRPLGPNLVVREKERFFNSVRAKHLVTWLMLTKEPIRFVLLGLSVEDLGDDMVTPIWT